MRDRMRLTVVIAGLAVVGLVAGSRALEGQAGVDVSVPAAAGEPAAEASDLKVDVKIARGVENREPTEVGDSFPASLDQVVGWTRVQGASEPTEIRHVWSHEGKEVAELPLQVKSSSYRTWTKKSIAGQAGSWSLTVKDAAGNVLASKDFTVTADAAQQ